MPDSYFDWLATYPIRPQAPDTNGGGHKPPQCVGVDFTFDSVEKDGSFTSRLLVRNRGSRNISRWKLEFDFAAGISQASGAKLLPAAGKHYKLAEADSVSVIPAGGSMQIRLRGTLARLDAKPENYTFNGVPVTYQPSNPTGTTLQAQLQRLLATRPPPLDGAYGSNPGGLAPGLEKHDRLITFGLELPRQTVVTEKQDRILLQERVSQCIKRHMPWAAALAVVASQDDENAGRTVVSVKVRVNAATDNGSLELVLDRLARDVELLDENWRARDYAGAAND